MSGNRIDPATGKRWKLVDAVTLVLWHVLCVVFLVSILVVGLVLILRGGIG